MLVLMSLVKIKLEAGVNVNFNEILRVKKGWKKENDFWNTNRQLIPTPEHPQVDFFGVYLLTSNYKFEFKTSLNLQH